MQLPYYTICVILWFGSQTFAQLDQVHDNTEADDGYSYNEETNVDNHHSESGGGKFGFNFQFGDLDEGGWDPPVKNEGWGWQPEKPKGWGWKPEKPKGWGWPEPKGWGWKPKKPHRHRRPKKGWGRRPKKGRHHHHHHHHHKKGRKGFRAPKIKYIRPRIRYTPAKIIPPRIRISKPRLKLVKGSLG